MNLKIDNQEYKIIGKLGKGGLGEVFKLLSVNAYYEDFNAVLKKIPINNLSKEEIEQYKEEIKIMEKLKFKSMFICSIISYFIDQKYLNILMEYGGDSSLKGLILKYKTQKKFIKEEIIQKIIRQICLGLREIHKYNLIHRNLTPENIFIDDNNDIRIGVLGISKILDSNDKYAKTHTGKLHYNAPEIEKGEKYNNKIDIYAFGCIIYELFTLNEYFVDKFYENKDKIDKDIYNPKWQELIDSLCQIDYHLRPSIEEIYEKLKNINIKNTNKKIKINFKNLKGRIFTIYCDNKMTIGEVKDEFVFQEGFNDYVGHLMCDGCVLNENKTLEDYMIDNGDVIKFTGPPCG